MALSPGTRLGVYEITAQIGAGGMGEVYRATDSHLKRSVAIKVLPATMAADADRLARFQREAEVLAALNHPNIAAIYGLEKTPDFTALVMELVDGEDLSQRLARGAIPIDEALPIAKQIAEALEAAHEQGIIHRDLKPANVKVRPDGTVKVLDFGLAKAAERGSGIRDQESAANSPTIAAPATQAGIILGTAAYMAPEQAKGGATDRRADVWAFGVVLYEMLTGKRLFGRPEVAETLAAVLTSNPDLTALPASTSPAIARLVARCLARDKRQRLDSMAVVRLELDEVHNHPATSLSSSSSYRMLIVAAAVVAGVFALGWFTSRLMDSRSIAPVSSETVISEIAAPSEVISAFHNGFALSPDGQTLVFTARLPNGVRQLWSRSIGSATARPIAGTEDGTYPFWSPDGRHVAFFTENRLKRVPIAGGQVQTICQAVGGFRSGSWSVRDEIVFGGLFVVSASGGTPRKLEALGAGLEPRWFADGRRFVYRGQDTLSIGAADGSPPKMIKGTSAQDYELAPGGHLLMNKDDVLIAQRIDEDTGQLVGPAVTIAGEAARPNNWMALSSRADRLIGYVRQSGDVGGDLGAPWARLEWVARDGAPAGTIGERARYWAHEVAPDGRRVAISASGSWILDGVRRTRLPGYQPMWSPDGRQFLYRQPTGEIYVKRIDSDEPAARLDGVSGVIVDWSRDGRWLTVDGHWGDQATGRDISLYDFQGHIFKSWLSTEFHESSARLSPDGRWMAYVSDANGQRDVYIRRVDGGGSPISVSTGGGIHPRWRRDGREMFFLGFDDTMMAVDLTLGAETVVVGTPKKLFTVPLNDISIGYRPPYDVTADGQRFLLNVPDRPEPLFFLQGLEAVIRKGGR